jgi:hypothetical protein
VLLDQLDALCSPEGRALLNRLAREDPAAIGSIRLGVALRAQFPAELVAAALSQHELRQAAANKFRLAGQMFFTRPGLEQASAEPISRHRAPRFAGCAQLADLCTGIGGDLIALAEGRPVAPCRTTVLPVAADRPGHPAAQRTLYRNIVIKRCCDKVATCPGQSCTTTRCGFDCSTWPGGCSPPRGRTR